MLGLSNKICRDYLGIGCLVSQNQTVSRPGYHVNANSPIENALGFGDKLITRPHQNVRLGQAK